MSDTINILELKPHPENPRKINGKDLDELKVSIQELNKMFEVRPIAYDEDNIIWGGNQRRDALIELGYTEIPKSWTYNMVGWTLAEKKAFLIKDNLHSAIWNEEKLTNEYWEKYAAEYGNDYIKSLFEDDAENGQELEGTEPTEVVGENVFSDEIDFLSNYIVLKFNNKIDWINIQSLLQLDSVFSKRQNGKEWAKGVGRVVDGAKAIEIIKKSLNETK